MSEELSRLIMADGTMILETGEQGGTALKIKVVKKLSKDRIAENLACVERHFHSEAQLTTVRE